MQRAKEWLHKIEGPTSIIYHHDGDGVCSAALLARELGRLRKELSMVVPNDLPGIGISDSLLLLAKNSFIIFTDLPVDEIFTQEKLGKTGRVLIIDHHVPRKNLTGEKVLHINPRFANPKIYQPASYLVYKMTKLPSLKWIAATGVIADHGEEDCKDLLDGFTKKSIATLTILSEAIAAAKAVNRINGIREAFDIFVKANEPKEVFNSPLIRYVDIFKQELERLESDFRENATFFSKTNAILYEVRSKYQITSSLANSIADKRSDEVIILLRCGKMLKVSARCMSGRVDVAKLLHDLVKNIGVGGGHEKAAGAAVPARHAEEFMQRLHEKLEFGF